MQIGAWYKFVNQKDENVNPTLKTTVADNGKSFLQVEKLISHHYILLTLAGNQGRPYFPTKSIQQPMFITETNCQRGS